MIERDLKMFMIVQYKTRDLGNIKRWTKSYPIDQLTDQFDMPLVFQTREECLQAMEIWGVDLKEFDVEGFEIERVQ
jgi:hypothetical protein|tara:strand:+ start:254 stop:481 length:228 start_codon:yes stop_codon:yes gene_type:complete